MTTSKKYLCFACLALAATLGSGAAYAQMQAGLLGQRHAGFSVFSEHLRNSNLSNGTGADLTLNLPVSANFDFLAGASYEKFSDYSVKDKRAFGAVRAFAEFKGVRPFIDLSLTGTWQSSKVAGTTYSSNDGLWGGGAGLEVPLADATALIGRVAHHRYFDTSNGNYTIYSIALQHWLSERTGAQAQVQFWESESILYSLGLFVRF